MSVRACRRALRDAEDQSRGREDQPRPAAGARARQPGRQARLGPRAGASAVLLPLPPPPPPPLPPRLRLYAFLLRPSSLAFRL